MKKEVLTYLKNEPRFRERKNKWRGIADLLIEKYQLDMDRRKLADIIAEASNADREWRMALKENVSLRGTDYKDKDILEQEKMLSLDYSPGHRRDVAQLKML